MNQAKLNKIGLDVVTYGSIAFLVFFLLVLGAFIQWQCEPIKNEVKKDVVYIPGETITEYKEGIADTVFIYAKVKGEVTKTVVNETKDHSIINDSLFLNDSIKVNYTLKTTPAVDSFSLVLDVDLPVKEITQVDTLLITRIDTLKFIETIKDESGKVKSFSYGVLSGFVASVILLIIL